MKLLNAIRLKLKDVDWLSTLHTLFWVCIAVVLFTFVSFLFFTPRPPLQSVKVEIMNPQSASVDARVIVKKETCSTADVHTTVFTSVFFRLVGADTLTIPSQSAIPSNVSEGCVTEYLGIPRPAAVASIPGQWKVIGYDIVHTGQIRQVITWETGLFEVRFVEE